MVLRWTSVSRIPVGLSYTRNFIQNYTEYRVLEFYVMQSSSMNNMVGGHDVMNRISPQSAMLYVISPGWFVSSRSVEVLLL
jgi:hypothetical protein